MTAIEAKLDAVMKKLGSDERRMYNAQEVGAVKEGIRSIAMGLVEVEPYLNANKSYTFKLNPNLPTHYTPALRNHENFSHGGGAQQGPRLGQNYHKALAQPRFQEHQ